MQFLLYWLIYTIFFFITSSKDLITISNTTFLDSSEIFNNSVILFSSEWCKNCILIENILKELFNSYDDGSHFPITFYKSDVLRNPDLAKYMEIKGYPTLFFFKNSSHKMEYQFDSTKQEIKYFIDAFFLHKIYTIKSFQYFEQIKNHFQLVFLCDPQIYPKIHFQFTAIDSLNYTLYQFYQVSRKEISNFHQKLFIKQENQNNTPDPSKQCIIYLKKKSDKFDSYIRFYSDNLDDYQREFYHFMKNNSKPYFSRTFTHRLRVYLIQTGHTAITQFIRKNTLIDSFYEQQFYNITRDIKNMADGRVLDQYNYYKNQLPIILENLIFLQVDVEKPLVRQLLDFTGDSYENMPQIYAFRFSLSDKIFSKYKFTQNHAYIQQSEIALWISNILNEGSREHYLHTKKKILYSEEEPLSSNLKKWNKRKNVILQLNKDILSNILSDRYVQMNNKKGFMAVLYVTNYCRYCMEIQIIMDQIAEEYEKYDNDFKLYFAKINLDLADNPFQELQISDVPKLFFFEKVNNYYDIKIHNKSQSDIKNNFEQLIKANSISSIYIKNQTKIQDL